MDTSQFLIYSDKSFLNYNHENIIIIKQFENVLYLFIDLLVLN